ncbi:hypothetical protein E4U21_003464 [Claviceps maximensis]|nr:hypothetical protein E4U21_003464 [Claviceps maximensis]
MAFSSHGALASSLVDGIVPNIVGTQDLFAEAVGVRQDVVISQVGPQQNTLNSGLWSTLSWDETLRRGLLASPAYSSYLCSSCIRIVIKDCLGSDDKYSGSFHDR